MKRTLVIGDIHGGLKGLIQVLERADVSEKDTLIFVGDYVDGWSESALVIRFLIELQNTHDCIFIRGNHDFLVEEYLTTNSLNTMWLNNGGKSTFESYNTISPTERDVHLVFFKSLINYYIDHNNRLFVHAGYTNQAGPEHEYHPNMVYWDRTLWEMAYSMDISISKNDERYPKRLKVFKEIYIGHTPTSKLGKFVPLNYANVWNVDTGAAFKGPVSILDIDTKKYWQSDPVHQLYPNESGRN